MSANGKMEQDIELEKMISIFIDRVKPLEFSNNLHLPYTRSIYFLQQKARLVTKNPHLKIRKCVGHWFPLAEPDTCRFGHILGARFWVRDGLIVTEANDRAAIYRFFSNYNLCSIELKAKKLGFNVILTALTLV